MLRYIPLTDDGLLDLSELGSLLTERTKICSASPACRTPSGRSRRCAS